jgi:alpha/beta superfamily hydrolase
VRTELDIENTALEHAGYFSVSGAHLYTVLHEARDPVAQVLLAGPFASERHNSYLPWVRWARYLAERRIDVLRFDYRGIGESTGAFEEMTFASWCEDVAVLADWLRSRPAKLPLVLHGLEIGALLAAKAFHNGAGDALLLWSPPANAHQALRSTLLRWVGLEHLYKPSEEVRPAAEYIRLLEQGTFVEVEGYQWSSSLWQDSSAINLPAPIIDDTTATSAYGRPVRIVKLDKKAAPLVKGGFVGYDEAKDFDWLFAPNSDWIASVASRGQGDSNGPSN